ncbi:1681_t:CDS:2, partial [Diversispora eburnea]
QALTYGSMSSQVLIQKFEETDPLLIDDIVQGVCGCITEPVRHPELSLDFLRNDPRGKQIEPDINKISKKYNNDNTHVFSTQREGKINEVTPPNYRPYNELIRETKLPVQKYGKVPDSYTISLKDRNIMLQKLDQSWNLQQYDNTTDASRLKHILFDMHMVLATKRMFQAETEFDQNKNSQLTKSEGTSLMPMSNIHSKEQKGDQRLVLPSGFEKSISTNNRRLITSSDPYLISEIQREKQQRHLSLQDITSHAETFRKSILASDPYLVNEIQREEQEKYLTLQDITSHTGAFRRPILTSDPYSMDEMQREDQERNLPLQDVTFNTGIFRRPILPSDLKFLYWQQQEDQNQNFVPSSQKPHPAKGILPVIYSEKAVQGSLVSNTFPNAHLTNIAKTLPKSAGADQYNIHVYSSAPPQILTERSNPDTLWQHTYENSPISGPPLSKWRNHTNDAMALRNSTETVFGSNASGMYGTAPTGPKTLRAYKESDSMNLHDGL